MYLPVPGFESTSSEFLDKCATTLGHSGRLPSPGEEQGREEGEIRGVKALSYML